jgi:hypothetical protein
MKNLLFLIVLGILPFCGHSQTFADDSKWEIGVNFLPLFDTSYYAINAYGTGWSVAKPLKNLILIKRKVSDALRIRTELGFTFKNKDYNPFTGEGQIDTYSEHHIGGHVSLGFEYALKFKKVTLWAGPEIYTSYLRSTAKWHKDTRPLANPPTIYKIRDFVSTRKYGINGLLGISVSLLPNIELLMYSKLNGEYKRIRTDYKQRESELLLLTFYGDEIFKNYSIDILPVSFIGVIYSF